MQCFFCSLQDLYEQGLTSVYSVITDALLLFYRDPDGLRSFYYLFQDLKCMVFSLIGLHFKIKPIWIFLWTLLWTALLLVFIHPHAHFVKFLATSHHCLSTVKCSGWFPSVLLHAYLADVCPFFFVSEIHEKSRKGKKLSFYTGGVGRHHYLTTKMSLVLQTCPLLLLIVYINIEQSCRSF